MQTITLLDGVHKKIAQGHPWVYRTQINSYPWPEGAEPAPGDLVDVCDSRGVYLGTGVYNPESMLTVRILTRRRENIDGELIRARVKAALDYRRLLEQPDTDCRRLIFAEADRLPGVIADQYADVIVMQILSFGMERFRRDIAEELISQCRPACLILQHEEAVRAKEGLPLEREIYYGSAPDSVDIMENGIRLRIDLAGGQKTGYYLDQKANHAAIRPFVRNKNVLDCFCYNGGFALNAAFGGAGAVTAIDISDIAIAAAKQNARLNNLESRIKFKTANVFDYLRQAVKDKELFDVIVLDPPAFAKNHAAKAAAVRGYKEINLSALKLLEPGGIMVTHSCSFHMSEALFVETVFEAARNARRTVRVIDLRRQDRDHPVLAGYPESHYLKSLWLEVLDVG